MGTAARARIGNAPVSTSLVAANPVIASTAEPNSRDPPASTPGMVRAIRNHMRTPAPTATEAASSR